MKEPQTRSLIHKMIGIVVAGQLVCAALLCGAALLHERSVRLRAFDVSLQGRSDSLLGAIQDAEDPDDNVMIDPSELKLPEEDVYAVYNQGGRLLGNSAVAPSALLSRHADEFRDAQVGRTRYRILQREAMRVIDRAENGGVGLKRPVTIVYASPEPHQWHEIVEAARFYLLTIAFATVLTGVSVAMLLRRALSPLSELAVAAAELSPPSLVFTAPRSVSQTRELLPLAEVLTHTAGRLREAFAKEHRFVSDAAHELKTATAVVRSSVQVLMLKRRTVDDYAAGLGRVLEDSGRVEALVAQMLQLASMEDASGNTAPAIDMGALVAATVERLQPFAEVRGIVLRFVRPPVLRVRLLPERATALVSNLVVNAVQHSRPDRFVLITLTSAQPRGVKLEVQDNGHGISVDALPHVFERFYREDQSRSRNTGGTGLGLSICKSIVDAAGGSISIESDQGQGTRVTVTFIPA